VIKIHSTPSFRKEGKAGSPM